jgi:hypothetical protein
MTIRELIHQIEQKVDVCPSWLLWIEAETPALRDEHRRLQRACWFHFLPYMFVVVCLMAADKYAGLPLSSSPRVIAVLLAGVGLFLTVLSAPLGLAAYRAASFSSAKHPVRLRLLALSSLLCVIIGGLGAAVFLWFAIGAPGLSH